VPYGPHLEPESEVCEEAAKKRKQDIGARSLAKRAKVSSQKASAKIVVVKAAQSKSTSGLKSCLGPSFHRRPWRHQRLLCRRSPQS
jgi:hypothetical protein